MSVNIGYFFNKLFRVINRPALRSCNIDKSAKVGTGSNCIYVTMGRYSYMGKNNSVTNTTIGAFCSIASYCAIGGGAHPLNMVSTSPVFYGGRNAFGKNFGTVQARINKPVDIGNDVWIGEGVFINDGIKIGDGAVIGGGAVVTHDVPPYAIAVGVPAKIIGYRCAPEFIERLEKIQWWNWPDYVLRENIDWLIHSDINFETLSRMEAIAF